MSDDSAQLPGPCQGRGCRGLTWVCPRSPADPAPTGGADWATPTGRRYRPTRSGRAHSRSETRRNPGLAAFPRSASVLAIGWHDIRPGRRGRVGRCTDVGASGRRGVGASSVRTQHGPALNARSGPARGPFQVQGRREKSDQPGPGRVRSSDGPTLTRGRRRMSQRRRDRAFDADGARAGSVPAAGTTPWSCRDDAVERPGPGQRRRWPSSQRISTRSWKPSPPS
jgi:hypothetical protein